MDTLWQVDDEFGADFVDGSPKSQWYESLGRLSLETAPELNAEESISVWDYVPRELPHPGATLFHGDAHTAQDDYSDPNVSFIGRERVKEIAKWLSFNHEAIRTAFVNDYNDHEFWLYEPLVSFFAQAAEKYKAIIILWEGPTVW